VSRFLPAIAPASFPVWHLLGRANVGLITFLHGELRNLLQRIERAGNKDQIPTLGPFPGGGHLYRRFFLLIDRHESLEQCYFTATNQTKKEMPPWPQQSHSQLPCDQNEQHARSLLLLLG
jgi:hypothetical protein